MITSHDTLPSPSSGPPSFQPGDVVGNYRLVQALGEGGMGQVFLADHLHLARRVAIKTLRPALAANGEAVRRFFQESRIVSELRHEHVVDILDFGQDSHGRVYFVMELLEGGDICAVREREGPFRLPRAVSILGQVASAMSAVHARKIIHRDLKPENVFLSRRGDQDHVKLLDFGLAKLSQSAMDVRDRTRAGAVLGTPDYMSPEQAAGLEVDWRTDIYSFGMVLFWMLTDELPFRGNSAERLTREVDVIPPLPPRSATGEPLPGALGELAARCLARDPADRPRTFSGVLDELNAIPLAARRAGALGSRAAVRGLRRWGLAAAALAGLALLGTMGWRWSRAREPATSLEPVAPVAKLLPPVPAAAVALPHPGPPPQAGEGSRTPTVTTAVALPHPGPPPQTGEGSRTPTPTATPKRAAELHRRSGARRRARPASAGDPEGILPFPE